MVQKVITFTGKVQKAGYRERLQDLARGLGITGFVENVLDPTEQFPSDESVKVVVQGTDKAVNTFIEYGSVKNTLINVERVEITGKDDEIIEFTDFYIHREKIERELGDRLDEGVQILKEILSVQKETKETIEKGNGRIISNANENTRKIIDHISKENEGMKNHTDNKYDDITDTLHSMSSELRNISTILKKAHNIEI